ncbi:cellulase family glycosylhydrolase [Kiritimatiellota bacterium B12222]|nr:cellulase family glycosylhydrolase [Kiritimatiellota bacterium B12222]
MLEREAPKFKRGVNISHWLAQNREDRPYGADWFTDEDVSWIAAQGFDHIRIPVDAKRWMNEDGHLELSALEPFNRACTWAQASGLGVILDMHTVPGANFSSKARDSSLFTDELLLAEVATFWGEVATYYAEAGSWLRFELLNEPVAEKNAQLNPVQDRLLKAIRESNPTRIVYVTSNQWSKFRTIEDVILPDDPYVALTLHFYDPLPFTHQRTDWTEYKPSMPQVDFPGVIPDLSSLLPPGHSRLALSNQAIDAERSVDPDFKRLAEWAAENIPRVEIHIGEFGVFQTATPDSIFNYYRAVVTAAERHNFGWAAWDYQGGFAIRASDGSPSSAMLGIAEGVMAGEIAVVQ